jgi:hypothetical protein
MGLMNAAYLNRVATSVPGYDVHETFVRFADSLLEDPRHQKLFRRMADRSEIHQLPLIGRPHGPL